MKMESFKKTAEKNVSKSSVQLVNNGVQKILECSIQKGNACNRKPLSEIFEKNSSSNIPQGCNKYKKLESSTKIQCDSQSEKYEKHSKTEISSRKSLDTWDHSTDQENQYSVTDETPLLGKSNPNNTNDGLFKCTHFEPKNSKKSLTKGKFIVNLLVAPAEKKNSSSKPAKLLSRSKSHEQIFLKTPESRMFFNTKQMRRNNEYAIIKELSKILPVLREGKNATEYDLLENERDLLVSTEKVKLYSKNTMSSKDESNTFFLDNNVVRISKILITLKSEYEEMYSNAYFISLVCTDDEIFPSKLVQLVPKEGKQCVEFDDPLELRRLAKNFQLSVKVYSYQKKNPKMERGVLLKFLPNKTPGYPVQICRCKNLLTDNKEEEIILLPVFKQCAEFIISKENVSRAYISNSYPNSIFHDFGFIKKTLTF